MMMGNDFFRLTKLKPFVRHYSIRNLTRQSRSGYKMLEMHCRRWNRYLGFRRWRFVHFECDFEGETGLR